MKTELVVVEIMPVCYRASHLAAGNRGQWPHNGAYREVLPIDEAEGLVEADPEWVTLLEHEPIEHYLDE